MRNRQVCETPNFCDASGANAAGDTASTATQSIAGEPAAPPVVTISSQILAADTRATDSSSAVVLSGTVTGALGATVQIFDGATSLGMAPVNDGILAFAVALGAGTHHTLHVLASDSDDNGIGGADHR
jgi:hypothetical protein